MENKFRNKEIYISDFFNYTIKKNRDGRNRKYDANSVTITLSKSKRNKPQVYITVPANLLEYELYAVTPYKDGRLYFFPDDENGYRFSGKETEARKRMGITLLNNSQLVQWVSDKEYTPHTIKINGINMIYIERHKEEES